METGPASPYRSRASLPLMFLLQAQQFQFKRTGLFAQIIGAPERNSVSLIAAGFDQQ